MKITEFVELVKKAKKGSFNTKPKLTRCIDTNIYSIREVCECTKCNSHSETGIKVIFKSQVQMSIFQVAMLYALFHDNKLLSDYAQYHKCKAGQEFIENIVSIEKW